MGFDELVRFSRACVAIEDAIRPLSYSYMLSVGAAVIRGAIGGVQVGIGGISGVCSGIGALGATVFDWTESATRLWHSTLLGIDLMVQGVQNGVRAVCEIVPFWGQIGLRVYDGTMVGRDLIPRLMPIWEGIAEGIL